MLPVGTRLEMAGLDTSILSVKQQLWKEETVYNTNHWLVTKLPGRYLCGSAEDRLTV